MFPQSHYTKAILWWLAAGCFLALFLFAGWSRTIAGEYRQQSREVFEKVQQSDEQ